MASITITIDDTQVDRILAAVCTAGGYTGVDTRIAKAAFAKQFLINHISTIVKQVEAAAAADAASQSAQANASNLPIT